MSEKNALHRWICNLGSFLNREFTVLGQNNYQNEVPKIDYSVFFFKEVHSLHLLFCWLKSFIQNLFVKTVDALDEPESVDYYTQTSFYQEQTSKCREYLRWSTFVQVAGWWITWFISSWEENNFCQSWAYQTIANYFQLTQSNSNWLRLPYFLI